MGACPRPRPGAAGPRLFRQHLIDRDPTLIEPIGAAGHVEAPDPITLLSRTGDRRIASGFESAHPMQEGARVVRPQALDIQKLELSVCHFARDAREMRELAAGKDMALHEIAPRDRAAAT